MLPKTLPEEGPPDGQHQVQVSAEAEIEDPFKALKTAGPLAQLQPALPEAHQGVLVVGFHVQGLAE